MIALSVERCSSCNKPKTPGTIFYLVKISLTADVDLELEELSKEELEREIQREFALALRRDEAELNNEVYQEIYYYLCSRCRDNFIKDPFGKLKARGETND